MANSTDGDCELPPPIPVLGVEKRRRLGKASPLLSPASFCSGFSEAQQTGAPDWWSQDAEDTANAAIFMAVKEVKRFVVDWKGCDQDAFWQRKSKKCVLSVVITRKEDGGLAVYRGMNTEVSLPAGSLCAERVAIARSATDMRCAADILAVATVDPRDELNPLWPCDVCQSWLSKLRTQNQDICVIALSAAAGTEFLVQINGDYVSSGHPALPAPPSPTNWATKVMLADDVGEMPWEAQDLVYVDGAWTFLHSAQQHVLKAARTRGSHLLVGVHSDECLRKVYGKPPLESFQVRLGRMLQNRHVCSVLPEAPWEVTHDLINSFGIRRVICGSVHKGTGGPDTAKDPYTAARNRGMLEVVPSLDDSSSTSLLAEQVKLALR